MTQLNRWIALVVAVFGTGICVTAMLRFLTSVRDNAIPWNAGPIPRDFYLAIGESYSYGFTVGFFLCFFLMMAAVCVGTWLEQRRERSRSRAEAVLAQEG